jgi:hypothetical protein
VRPVSGFGKEPLAVTFDGIAHDLIDGILP